MGARVAVAGSRTELSGDAPFEVSKKLRASMDAEAWSRVLRNPSSIVLYVVGLAVLIGASAFLIEAYVPQHHRIALGISGSLGSLLIVALLLRGKRRHFHKIQRENGFEVCVQCGYPMHRLPRTVTRCSECGAAREPWVPVIQRMYAGSLEARALMRELDDELRARYPGFPIHSLHPGEEDSPQLLFFAVKSEGEWAACGALRLHTRGLAEVKRMYVHPKFRKRGIARALLERLELQARDERIRTLRLETGVAQPEALALYRSAGYVEIPKYGEYENDPHSVCFEKKL